MKETEFLREKQRIEQGMEGLADGEPDGTEGVQAINSLTRAVLLIAQMVQELTDNTIHYVETTITNEADFDCTDDNIASTKLSIGASHPSAEDYKAEVDRQKELYGFLFTKDD